MIKQSQSPFIYDGDPCMSLGKSYCMVDKDMRSVYVLVLFIILELVLGPVSAGMKATTKGKTEKPIMI